MLPSFLVHLLLSGFEQAGHVGEQYDAMVAERSQVPDYFLKVLLSDVEEPIVTDYREIWGPLLCLSRDYLLPQPLEIHCSIQNG